MLNKDGMKMMKMTYRCGSTSKSNPTMKVNGYCSPFGMTRRNWRKGWRMLKLKPMRSLPRKKYLNDSLDAALLCQEGLQKEVSYLTN